MLEKAQTTTFLNGKSHLGTIWGYLLKTLYVL